MRNRGSIKKDTNKYLTENEAKDSGGDGCESRLNSGRSEEPEEVPRVPPTHKQPSLDAGDSAVPLHILQPHCWSCGESVQLSDVGPKCCSLSQPSKSA